jgi:hypothetical protein
VNYIFCKLSVNTKHAQFQLRMSPSQIFCWKLILSSFFLYFFRSSYMQSCGWNCPRAEGQGAKKKVCFVHRILDVHFFSKKIFALDSAWCHLQCDCYDLNVKFLTPKGPRPFFGPFLKFGQAIVDAIFVQKISNFRWTCGLVLASRRTSFYKIPIYSLGAMLQKQNYFEVRAARAAKKTFYFKTFLGWIFLYKFFTKFLIIPSTWKSSKTHGIY